MSEAKEEIKYLSTANLTVSPYNVRDHPEEGIEDLIKSIREVGILQPLIVRPIGPRKYEVVVGARRLMAAKAVGLRKVPCLVRKISDRDALILSLAENLQRGSLTQEEIQKAVMRLHKDFNMPTDLIAKRLGVDIAFVTDLIRIREALSVIKERVSGEVRVVKKPGRYRQRIERAREEIPITVATAVKDIAVEVQRQTGLSAEDIERELMPSIYELKQKQVQYVKEMIKRELPKVMREVKEPEKVKEIMLKRVEEVKKRIMSRRQVVVLIDEQVLANVRALASKLEVSDDDIIEGALKFSLSKVDEFTKFFKKEYST